MAKNVTVEIADGVYWLNFGVLAGSVYLVRSASGWALIDASMAGREELIHAAIRAIAGEQPSEAILLTHVHPDHSGSAKELARRWNCPVFIHPHELALAVDRRLETIVRFSNPLDRGLIIPLLRLIPPRRRQRLLEVESLAAVARTLPPDGSVPVLSDWRYLHTPGHSPGHVVFFRERDRVLLAGDAVLTIDGGSLRWLLGWMLGDHRPRIAPPPWYTNWDQGQVVASMAELARLDPFVLATGHGPPMAEAAATLRIASSLCR